MTMFSRMVGLQRFVHDTDGAVTLDNAVLISLAAVACFAVIGLLGAPISIVLGKVMLLSISLACIAGITILAKWHGVLSEDALAQGRSRIDA
jgi:Flp pilus assembly pilin Flp